MSRSWVDIDLDAIARNVGALMAAAPDSGLCAVVKADGYGHGANEVARATLDAGATVLAVAQVDEGAALRDAGIDARIWVLSEPEPHEFVSAAGFGLEPAIYSERGIEAAASVARAAPLTVHLKVDTGMHRVGAHTDDAVALATAIERASGLQLGSVWTHCATADEPGNPYTDRQLDRYEQVLDAMTAAGVEVPLRHAANSAGTLAHPRAHHDIVRTGIALYGLAPSQAMVETACDVGLTPALTWRSNVAYVKRLRAGDRVSYGQRAGVDQPTTAATIPLGYADGYRRGLWQSGAVLIGGVRRPIIGVVTMDQIVVDCGDDDVAAGDDVVVIGEQTVGSTGDRITADDLAADLDTINYEVVCGISKRVERVHR